MSQSTNVCEHCGAISDASFYEGCEVCGQPVSNRQLTVTFEDKFIRGKFWNQDTNKEEDCAFSFLEAIQGQVSSIRVLEVAEEMINQIRESQGLERLDVVKPEERE